MNEEQGKSHKNLFSEFPPVSTADWEAQIMKDLKGADYNKKLVWQTVEGIDVKPYYRNEHLEGISHLDSAPGEYPNVRGLDKKTWRIRQNIYVKSIEQANQEALEAINNGASCISFIMAPVPPTPAMQKLLNGIDPAKSGISFANSDCFRDLLDFFVENIEESGIDPQSVFGSFEVDPLANLMANGQLTDTFATVCVKLHGIILNVGKELPNYRCLSIRGYYYHNAGASAVQELAFTLATANEYFAQLTNQSLPIDKITPHFQMTLGVGSNYFIEIAKIRAARLLYSKIIEQYHPEHKSSHKLFINCINSRFNKTVFDPYTNLLRATTEAMSAIIGGVDCLIIEPFDIAYKEPDAVSNRLSRNIQNILLDESYLNKVQDVAAGSYYIENLTDQIATKAWELFKEIEARGGFYEAALQGFIQDEIDKTNEKRKVLMTSGRENMLGTNIFPNFGETMLDSVERDIFSPENVEGKTVRPIRMFRKSEEFEKLRLMTEEFVKKGNKQPAVFLLQIGNPGMSSARSIFSGNFFGVAGFEIISNPRFNSIDEAVEEAIASKSEIVVICSADDEYLTYAPEIAEKIKSGNAKCIVVVAGFPKDITDTLKQKGIDDFIHLKSAHMDTLISYQQKFGIIQPNSQK
jgi:methylmalonyl-CoA mutase